MTLATVSCPKQPPTSISQGVHDTAPSPPSPILVRASGPQCQLQELGGLALKTRGYIFLPAWQDEGLNGK